MNKNIIDLTNDVGFEKISSLIPTDAPQSVLSADMDNLIQKQAYADASSFADPENKMFSVASPVETYISALYATKCASDLSDDIVNKIKEACDVFNIDVEICKNGQTKTASTEVVESEVEEPQKTIVEEYLPDDTEKYASCTDYGTELDTCMAARALNAPDYAEDFEKVASLRSEFTPREMTSIISQLDSEAGLDYPEMQQRVGSPNYAVFEKRASFLTIDLGVKSVPFEKLAEAQDYMNDMGVEVNFDTDDPYAIKLAVENLPKQIKKAIASVC